MRAGGSGRDESCWLFGFGREWMANRARHGKGFLGRRWSELVTWMGEFYTGYSVLRDCSLPNTTYSSHLDPVESQRSPAERLT